MATLCGGWQLDYPFDATRWNGERVTDYFMANFDLPAMQVREEKISDHKIVTCKFEHFYKKDAEQWRFQPGLPFTKPLWIGKTRWHELFDEAYRLGQQDEWVECCKMVEAYQDWDQCEDDDGQIAIDYAWCLICAQVSWAFAKANQLALFEAPSHSDNEAEMGRVLHLVNHSFIKGYEYKMQKRKFGNKPGQQSQKIKRRCVRIGHLHELLRRLQRGNRNEETRNLAKRLYGDHDLEHLRLQEVRKELQQQEALLQEEEETDMKDALGRWRHDMRCNIKAKTSWINKKIVTFN